jgi:hypothetical protein
MARPSRPKAAGLATPQFTPDGATRLQEVIEGFRHLFNSRAVHQAQRRGAKGVDNTDVDTAYRDLLRPRERPLVVDVLAEFGLVASGALVGYAATLLTSVAPQYGPGLVMLIAGLFLGSLCAVLKHVRF